jgi:hypothetical protein
LLRNTLLSQRFLGFIDGVWTWIIVTVDAFTAPVVGVSLLEFDRRTHNEVGVVMWCTMGPCKLKYQAISMFAKAGAPPGYRSVLSANKTQHKFGPCPGHSGVSSTATEDWLGMSGPCFGQGSQSYFRLGCGQLQRGAKSCVAKRPAIISASPDKAGSDHSAGCLRLELPKGILCLKVLWQ